MSLIKNYWVPIQDESGIILIYTKVVYEIEWCTVRKRYNVCLRDVDIIVESFSQYWYEQLTDVEYINGEVKSIFKNYHELILASDV